MGLLLWSNEQDLTLCLIFVCLTYTNKAACGFYPVSIEAEGCSIVDCSGNRGRSMLCCSAFQCWLGLIFALCLHPLWKNLLHRIKLHLVLLDLNHCHSTAVDPHLCVLRGGLGRRWPYHGTPCAAPSYVLLQWYRGDVKVLQGARGQFPWHRNSTRPLLIKCIVNCLTTLWFDMKSIQETK